MKKAAFEILDTTLRDGSYAINFSFTSLDTEVIARALEDAGIDWIEVGHGAGLSASVKGHGEAAATDEDYMKAARRALKRARYGMFCIPGIATLDDLDLAKKHRMDFIRIGTNAAEVAQSEAFIRKAKKIGMYVAANYMKSYTLDPKQFAQKVKLSERYGADAVYVVDSAGGMLPGTVAPYMKEIRKVSDIRMGFHAHNNLGMAVANTLVALAAGATLLDASLQGLGRSSGNACTEMLVAALQKSDCFPKPALKPDLMKLLRAGQRHVRPLVRMVGSGSLDIISGFADFHSSYMPKILKAAAEYRVEPERLIVELCKEDRTNADDALLKKIGTRLQKSAPKPGSEPLVAAYHMENYVGYEQDRGQR